MAPIQKKIKKYMDKIKVLIEDNAHLDEEFLNFKKSL